MIEKLSEESAESRIAKGLDRLIEGLHPLKNVVQAFRGLLLERARLKTQLPDLPVVPGTALDPARFEQGLPLTSIEALVDAMDDGLWTYAAGRLLPVMEGSFPKIREDLRIIRIGLVHGRFNPGDVLKASLAGCEGETMEAASMLEISPPTLVFALGQIAKPIIEKHSENLGPLVEDFSWKKGYCPICGTMPELAFLQGEGGQRWLRCASCAHEWRFQRLICPFCESDRQEDFEVYFVADQEYESLSLCNKCRRYVPTIDMRDRPEPIPREVAAMALMHLDIIAQGKGFLPAAVCAWNVVTDRDIFSTFFDKALLFHGGSIYGNDHQAGKM
jgi:FdhE protein